MRLAETLRPNRNKVMMSNSDGKTENCSGSVMYMAIKTINTDTPMLRMRAMSSSVDGSGAIIMPMISAKATAISTSLY